MPVQAHGPSRAAEEEGGDDGLRGGAWQGPPAEAEEARGQLATPPHPVHLPYKAMLLCVCIQAEEAAEQLQTREKPSRDFLK